MRRGRPIGWAASGRLAASSFGHESLPCQTGTERGPRALDIEEDVLSGRRGCSQEGRARAIARPVASALLALLALCGGATMLLAQQVDCGRLQTAIRASEERQRTARRQRLLPCGRPAAPGDRPDAALRRATRLRRVPVRILRQCRAARMHRHRGPPRPHAGQPRPHTGPGEPGAQRRPRRPPIRDDRPLQRALCRQSVDPVAKQRPPTPATCRTTAATPPISPPSP